LQKMFKKEDSCGKDCSGTEHGLMAICYVCGHDMTRE